MLAELAAHCWSQPVLAPFKLENAAEFQCYIEESRVCVSDKNTFEPHRVLEAGRDEL